LGKICEFLGFCSGIVEVPVLFGGAVSKSNWRQGLRETICSGIVEVPVLFGGAVSKSNWRQGLRETIGFS